MWQVWLILAGIFVIFEMVIPTDFLIFWVGMGAIVSCITSIFVDNITAQIVVFCISSILLIFCTKPFVKKFMKKAPDINTNAYSILGKKGLVITDIDPISSKGQIKVDSEIWSAKTLGTDIIPKDTQVTVTAIEGVKAVVTAEKKAEIKI